MRGQMAHSAPAGVIFVFFETNVRASCEWHAKSQRDLLREPDLHFGRLLLCQLVQEALLRSGIVFRERLYTLLVTLWAFLNHVLCPDPCCRAVVTRLLVSLDLRENFAVSADTGPHCKARERLLEVLVADLAPAEWDPAPGPIPRHGTHSLWRGRLACGK
jgi:hypothetical protein